MSALPRCAPPLGHVDPEDHVPEEEEIQLPQLTEEVEIQMAQTGTGLSNWHHTDDLSDWFNQRPIRPFSYLATTSAARARTAAPASQRLTLSDLSTERDRQEEQFTFLQKPSNSTAEAPARPGIHCSHVKQLAPGCTAAPRRFTLKTELQLQLSEHVHPAAAGAVNSTIQTILHEDSAMALRPSSMVQLMQAATLIQNLNARSMADSTNAQDRGSNWNWWTQWCKTWNTPTVRVYNHSRATTAEVQRECFLWTAAIPWFLVRMRPGPGRQFPLPSSAVAILRGVRRVHVHQMKFEPPPSRVLNDTLKGLMRAYQEEHGPESLEPHRTEPIPHKETCGLMRLLRQTDIHCNVRGTKILQTVADDLMHHSLRALVATHMETGLRKAETTSKTKVMTLKDMTRANLTWSIDDIYVTEPSRRQLESLVPGRDFALLKPPTSKSDQWGAVWGNLHIYLTFQPEMECNAAAALAELELFHAVQSAADRRKTPLFLDNQARPITGSEADKWILKALEVIQSPVKYSWHSFRVALACSLLASGATHAEIQALCRWQSEDSLRIYARMSQPHYQKLLRAAYGADISQVQPHTLPRTSDLGLAQELNTFTVPETLDDSDYSPHLLGEFGDLEV